MKTFILANFLVLAQLCFSQNLVVTSDDRWMSAKKFQEKRILLEKQGIVLKANGVLVKTSSNNIGVVTCRHVHPELSYSKKIGTDAIYIPVKDVGKLDVKPLPIGHWDPNKPVMIRSFLPEKNILIRTKVYPQQTSLLEEISLTLKQLLRFEFQHYGWETYATVSKGTNGSQLFIPGVSGSPLIQDGKIVGVVSWVVLESKQHPINKNQFVGFSLFGHRPRSKIIIYGSIFILITVPISISVILSRLILQKLKPLLDKY